MTAEFGSTHAMPVADPQLGLAALQAMLAERSPLAALRVFHRGLGDVFRINLPGFQPVVLAGPEAARFVLVEGRAGLRWRNDGDPVTALLRHGVLVEDGDTHDALRGLMNPALHRRMLVDYAGSMARITVEESRAWRSGQPIDMLVEMRRIALRILTETLFGADIGPEMKRMWQPVLETIAYISPGLWMVWPQARRGRKRGLAEMDRYLFALIRERRAGTDGDTLLDLLIASGLDDDLIRDQLLTMLIAGHDTSTALLAWVFALLGQHPQISQALTEEVRTGLGADALDVETLNRLPLLDQVIRETLRLYPPIHLGSRVAAVDMEYAGYLIRVGERVLYSIYLTQRDPAEWEAPDDFRPERHAGKKPRPYAWLAFGGGPRNCIGAAFGLLEAKIVLATILLRFDLGQLLKPVYAHMGATLEPSPGVYLEIQPLSVDSEGEK